MKRLLLTSLASLLLTPGSFAIIDANQNGLSDLWERAQNQGSLFPETFDPQADPDSDGWTNAQEAAAGTDPLDPNPPDGLIRPEITHIPAVLGEPDENGVPIVITPEAVTVTWPTLVGKQYTLLFSPDLTEGSWIPIGESFISSGGEVTYVFEVNDSEKRFWRVAAGDVDSDRDGLTDAEEHALGTDANGDDSDWDGISDREEIALGISPVMFDSDDDGSGDGEELLGGKNPLLASSFPPQWRYVERSLHYGFGNPTPDTPPPYSHLRTEQRWEPVSSSITDHPLELEWSVLASNLETLHPFPAQPTAPRFTRLSSWVNYGDLIPSGEPPKYTSLSHRRYWLVTDEAPIRPLSRTFIKVVNASVNGQSIPGTLASFRHEVSPGEQTSVPTDIIESLTTNPASSSQEPHSERISVSLVPAEVVSRDKFLAGSFRIPESFENLEMEFGGPEELGRYGGLLGGGTTKVYESVEAMLNAPPDAQPPGQKVWFVRDSGDPRKIRFYTCYSVTGTAVIKLHPNAGGSAAPAVVTHELTAAPDFGDLIVYVDRWVKGSSFTGEWSGTSWLAMNGGEIEGVLDNQTRACLIPFFDVIDQVTGFTPLVMGLCDGVRTGFHDDIAFLEMLHTAAVTSSGWVYATAKAEIDGWLDNPTVRVEQLKLMLSNLCCKTVLPKLSQLGQRFTTWEGFRSMAWGAWERARGLDEFVRLVPLASARLVVDGVISWGDDFCTRMMTGAEKTAWDVTPWDSSPLLNDIETFRNRAWYTYGYTFGYLGEQCAAAVVSAGTVTVAKICARNGITMAGRLAPRAMAVVAMRLHYIKDALADVDLLGDGLRLAHEGAMSSAARAPTTPLIKEIPASLMENRMANPNYTRELFCFKDWIKTATKNGNVRKLIKTSGREGQHMKKAAEWMELMGDKVTASASKGWAEIYERLLKLEGDTFVEDRAEDFFKLMKLETAEGKEAARKTLEDYAARVANDPNAKLWVKDLQTIQQKGYRYINQFELDQINANGGKLPLHPEREGQYFTLDGAYASGEEAKNALQLPRPATEYIGRIEFDLAPQKDKIRVPRGEEDSVDFFEPLARDNPDLGNSGGGSQLLLDSAQPEVTFKPFGQF